jgi:hypothetical protein
VLPGKQIDREERMRRRKKEQEKGRRRRSEPVSFCEFGSISLRRAREGIVSRSLQISIRAKPTKIKINKAMGGLAKRKRAQGTENTKEETRGDQNEMRNKQERGEIEKYLVALPWCVERNPDRDSYISST